MMNRAHTVLLLLRSGRERALLRKPLLTKLLDDPRSR